VGTLNRLRSSVRSVSETGLERDQALRIPRPHGSERGEDRLERGSEKHKQLRTQHRKSWCSDSTEDAGERGSRGPRRGKRGTVVQKRNGIRPILRERGTG
jgi:hypothetical protein